MHTPLHRLSIPLRISIITLYACAFLALAVEAHHGDLRAASSAIWIISAVVGIRLSTSVIHTLSEEIDAHQTELIGLYVRLADVNDALKKGRPTHRTP